MSTVVNFVSQKATLNLRGTQISSILWLCFCHHVTSISSLNKAKESPAIMATLQPTGNEKSGMVRAFLLRACPKSCK